MGVMRVFTLDTSSSMGVMRVFTLDTSSSMGVMIYLRYQ
jgi:hypothetical protein